MSSPPTTVNEYDAIARTVQHYIEGAKSGRGADMKPAFHQDSTIFGYVGADLFAGPIQQSLTGMTRTVQPRTPSPDCQHRHIGTIATVRLELDNWTGHRFTDLFTLLKVNGEWKIMNKVFHPHPEEKAGDEADGLDEQRMRATGMKTEDRNGNHTLSLV